ncbi:MAG TPA: hypothetical protein VKA74_01575 [Myxococcota bacterium]|nr:hypothetical protein [Myxococcota bacterium]
MQTPDPSLRCRFRCRSRARRLVTRLGLALALGLIAATFTSLSAVPTARAQLATEEELQAQKQYWQERYRMLLRNAALLERNARRSREDYAQAQRRNYPRGGARQRLLAQAAEAEAELRTVREEIEALRVEARREGALPGWLYEVEDEEIVVPEPAAPDGSDSSSDERDAGRNPLYLDDD